MESEQVVIAACIITSSRRPSTEGCNLVDLQDSNISQPRVSISAFAYNDAMFVDTFLISGVIAINVCPDKKLTGLGHFGWDFLTKNMNVSA